MYLPAENYLYSLNPDGSLHFQFLSTAGLFNTALLIDPSSSQLYGVAGSVLYAFDTASGAVRWQKQLGGAISGELALDAANNVLVGSSMGELLIVSPAGRTVTRLNIAGFSQVLPVMDAGQNMLVRAGDKTLVMIGERLPTWEGSQDVEPSETTREWQLSNPVALDIGADQLNDAFLPGIPEINGSGVTVAVVDSGVYFNDKVKAILGNSLDQHFLGQVDFVKGGICLNGGSQYDTYCFVDKDRSCDNYGHGSHVAGIIWSQIVDYATGVTMGIAPEANILSVHILGDNGIGSYEDVIEGIQYVVEHKDQFNIRVMNLSLSANPSTPYFIDPLNRAVEQAWAHGIVVVAAAGNTGPASQTITVPGNDPYVITVGAINNNRTAGYWEDDTIPNWSSTGPTLDGFAKPDVLTTGMNIISFMYNDSKNPDNSARLAKIHPDYSKSVSLFRMHGTSMSTAIASGAVALMLQVNPNLSPDQVKFRLKYSAHVALSPEGEPAYNLLQQGHGRIWAPGAVLGAFPADGIENTGMDIDADLAHGAGWVDSNQDGLVQYDELDPLELSYHYQGSIARMRSDDGTVDLYYSEHNGNTTVLGAASAADHTWLDSDQLDALAPSWNNGQLSWVDSQAWAAGNWTWGGGNWTWGGGNWTWGGGNWTWGGGNWTWGGGNWTWGGGNWTWGGGTYPTRWVNDDGSIEAPPSPPDTLYLSDLDGFAAPNQTKWGIGVTITVLNKNQIPVPDAEVYGIFSFGQVVSCKTNASGQCTVASREYEGADVGILSFNVRDVVKDGYLYADELNIDTDHDSDGTTISVARPVPTAINVADLDAAPSTNADKWRTSVTFRVLDANHNPVAAAKVYGAWSYGSSANCTTDALGACSLLSNEVSGSSVASLSFTVATVTHAEVLVNSYQPAGNYDPDGDSDGTTILMVKPE